MTLSNRSTERLHHLQTQMAQAGVDVVAIAPTAKMRYLLGFAPLADQALLTGVTEHHVAGVIAACFRDHGAETVDFTIVASGPNGAFPHHETGQRPLQVGDTIILDIGATLAG